MSATPENTTAAPPEATQPSQENDQTPEGAKRERAARMTDVTAAAEGLFKNLVPDKPNEDQIKAIKDKTTAQSAIFTSEYLGTLTQDEIDAGKGKLTGNPIYVVNNEGKPVQLISIDSVAQKPDDAQDEDGPWYRCTWQDEIGDARDDTEVFSGRTITVANAVSERAKILKGFSDPDEHAVVEAFLDLNDPHKKTEDISLPTVEPITEAAKHVDMMTKQQVQELVALTAPDRPQVQDALAALEGRTIITGDELVSLYKNGPSATETVNATLGTLQSTIDELTTKLTGMQNDDPERDDTEKDLAAAQQYSDLLEKAKGIVAESEQPETGQPDASQLSPDAAHESNSLATVDATIQGEIEAFKQEIATLKAQRQQLISENPHSEYISGLAEIANEIAEKQQLVDQLNAATGFKGDLFSAQVRDAALASVQEYARRHDDILVEEAMKNAREPLKPTMDTERQELMKYLENVPEGKRQQLLEFAKDPANLVHLLENEELLRLPDIVDRVFGKDVSENQAQQILNNFIACSSLTEEQKNTFRDIAVKGLKLGGKVTLWTILIALAAGAGTALLAVGTLEGAGRR